MLNIAHHKVHADFHHQSVIGLSHYDPLGSQILFKKTFACDLKIIWSDYFIMLQNNVGILLRNNNTFLKLASFYFVIIWLINIKG